MPERGLHDLIYSSPGGRQACAQTNLLDYYYTLIRPGIHVADNGDAHDENRNNARPEEY